MVDRECTTVAMDWTSSLLTDMTTFNDSHGMPAPAVSTYKTDTALMYLFITTGVIGFILNIAAVTVLLQKNNRRITANHYLVMLAVGEYIIIYSTVHDDLGIIAFPAKDMTSHLRRRYVTSSLSVTAHCDVTVT